MGDVIPLQRRKTAPGKGDTLCRNGHHRWQIWQRKPFDVKQGKLVTVYRCERCGKTRSRAE